MATHDEIIQLRERAEEDEATFIAINEFREPYFPEGWPCRCNPHGDNHPHNARCDAVCFCEACGHAASVVEFDDGVGYTEYWGSVSFDSRIVVATTCCEASPCWTLFCDSIMERSDLVDEYDHPGI